MKIHYSDGRVGIRPYTETDIDSLYEAARGSVDDIYPWLPWCHPRYSYDDSVNWVRSRDAAWGSETEYSFVITDTQTGNFLGGVGINEINRIHNVGNLGYWVRSGATRRGIATSATILTARFGFEQLRLDRIEIIAAVDNRASQRVAEKAGAQKEGMLRRRLLINGIHHDAFIYSLIPDDLR
jgi:ribosomal-protein-serine acetyltransferase